MTFPVPEAPRTLAHASTTPNTPVGDPLSLVADTYALGARVSLPARIWPADIPCPAPANTPRLLRELKTRLGRYFDTPHAWLPSLNAANGSRRQQRSERRVACVQLVRALIKFCDVSTLRIAVPAQGGWVDFTLPYLAEQAGLSVRRAERALHDLVTARLVKSRQQCELQVDENGPRYRGLAAIRYVSPALFEQFGLGKWLRHERTRAHLRAQRQRDAARKRERKGSTGAGPLLDKLTSQIEAIRTKAKHRDGQPNGDRQVEFERAIMIRAGELKATYPTWDRDRCFRIARAQLAPPR